MKSQLASAAVPTAQIADVAAMREQGSMYEEYMKSRQASAAIPTAGTADAPEMVQHEANMKSQLASAAVPTAQIADVAAMREQGSMYEEYMKSRQASAAIPTAEIADAPEMGHREANMKSQLSSAAIPTAQIADVAKARQASAAVPKIASVAKVKDSSTYEEYMKARLAAAAVPAGEAESVVQTQSRAVQWASSNSVEDLGRRLTAAQSTADDALDEAVDLHDSFEDLNMSIDGLEAQLQLIVETANQSVERVSEEKAKAETETMQLRRELEETRLHTMVARANENAERLAKEKATIEAELIKLRLEVQSTTTKMRSSQKSGAVVREQRPTQAPPKWLSQTRCEAFIAIDLYAAGNVVQANGHLVVASIVPDKQSSDFQMHFWHADHGHFKYQPHGEKMSASQVRYKNWRWVMMMDPSKLSIDAQAKQITDTYKLNFPGASKLVTLALKASKPIPMTNEGPPF